VSNAEVRETTGCSPLSHLVTNRRLRLFGHIGRSSPREDHHRALAAAIRQLPPDWKRPAGRPSHTWLRVIEADLRPLNFGLATAWRKATTRDEWRQYALKEEDGCMMTLLVVCCTSTVSSGFSTMSCSQITRFCAQLRPVQNYTFLKDPHPSAYFHFIPGQITFAYTAPPTRLLTNSENMTHHHNWAKAWAKGISLAVWHRAID